MPATQAIKLFKLIKLVNAGSINGYPFLSNKIMIDRGTLNSVTSDYAVAEFTFLADYPVSGITLLDGFPVQGTSKVIWSISKKCPSEISGEFEESFDTEDAVAYA